MDSTVSMKELRDYAWDYFSLHADQRLKTFHFFILISAFIFTSCAALARIIGVSFWMAIPMFSISLLAFAFWKLDKRNKQLVRVGEEALKEIESNLIAQDVSIKLCPFINEQLSTAELKDKKKNSLSYSMCFGFVFFGFGSTGLLSGIYIISALV